MQRTYVCLISALSACLACVATYTYDFPAYNIESTRAETTTSTTTTTTSTTTTTTTTTPMPCPNGWTQYDTNCFLFVATAVDAPTARMNCQANDGELVSIHSQAENDFISGITGGVRTYIGIIHADQNPTTFQWSDGSAFGPYINWRPGEPTLMAGETCGVINVLGGGTWDDATCSPILPYVCEMPATGG